MKMTANPRRRRRRAAPPKKRRRRRNAGIVPFTATGAGMTQVRANPLILNNPRRRRRRRNPTLKIEGVAKKLLMYAGGAGIGATVNILGLNKIDDMYMRNAARVAVATMAGIFIRGDMGAAAAGAALYPVYQELALKVLAPTEADLEADLDTLAADLEDVLYEDDPNGGDDDYYEEYQDDYQ